MQVEVKNNKLIITTDILPEAKPSASGKTRVVASSRGNQRTNVTVNGQPLTVGFNAYIPNR